MYCHFHLTRYRPCGIFGTYTDSLLAPLTVFEVTVETGKKRLAGTDANVYITLHGTKGSSLKHHLNAHNRGSCFQRGQTDKFKIRVGDIGEIRSMRLRNVFLSHSLLFLLSGWWSLPVLCRSWLNPVWFGFGFWCTSLRDILMMCIQPQQYTFACPFLFLSSFSSNWFLA